MWKVELIHKSGSSISCLGKTPTAAMLVAKKISKWFNPAWQSGPYMLIPSKLFPGIPNGTMPNSEKAHCPLSILEKYFVNE